VTGDVFQGFVAAILQPLPRGSFHGRSVWIIRN
jgi:hypothetical protein